MHIADTASQIEVWYNDAPVSDMTRTDAFGINPIGRIQLGENTPGQTYDIAFDDVAAATAYINGSTPAATPTLPGTATATNAPTATRTLVFTPTNTTVPTATATFAIPPTSTSTPSAVPTQAPPPTATSTVISGQPMTFLPDADSYVNSTSPTANYGSATTLRADGSPDLHSYVRFTVTSLGGLPITRARLLFHMNSTAKAGMQALAVSDNTWGEKSVNYGNAPALGGTITNSGALATGTWVTLDVTAYVTGEGTYSFGIITPGASAISFSSRESGSLAPQLIVDVGP